MSAPNRVYRCRACGWYVSQIKDGESTVGCNPECTNGIRVYYDGEVRRQNGSYLPPDSLGIDYTDETRDWSRDGEATPEPTTRDGVGRCALCGGTAELGFSLRWLSLDGKWYHQPNCPPNDLRAAAPEPASPFVATAAAIGKLVAEKNAAYGDAAAKSAAILSQLYPDGIAPAQYRNALLIVRVLDKLCRIAAGNDGAFGESAWTDIAGYGVLGATRKPAESDDDRFNEPEPRLERDWAVQS